MEKSKAEESLWWKRKKYRPKEERKSTTLARKEKNPSWKRLAVAELHAGVQISNKEVAVKTKFAIHNVKNEVSFPFCMPCYKNMNNRLECNFESCRSICCLAPQHIFRFFHFRQGFFLCLWQLCSLLCRPPQRSLSDRDIKKGVSNGLLFPGNLDPSSLTPGGPVVLLVWGFKRRRDNLLAWRELFANLYELKSCIRFWEEYNHFERIYRVFRFDRFLSNLAKTFRE